MPFVLRIVLVLMLAFGGTPSNATAHASPSPCEHVATVGPAGATSDDCPGTASGHADHQADHCIVASSGCCMPPQVATAFKAPVTTTAEVDWLLPIDHARLGRTFAPATPPPRA